jgi:hypothetical protein
MDTDSKHTGSCYGFDVTSEVPMAFLRRSTGRGLPLDVRFGSPPEPDGEPLQEWNAERKDILATRLFAMDEGRYLIRIGSEASFQVRVDPPGLVVHHTGNPDPISLESMLWGTPAAVSIAHQGRLPFHAGSVDVDGRGLVFVAAGTYGKTTLAGAFHSAGFRLLADDLSCAGIDPEPAVFPGPAAIRARPDVADGFTFAGASPALVTPAKTHYALSNDTKGSGDPVPLRAIVFLRVGEQVTLHPAPVADAVRDLFGLSYRLPTESGQIESFDLIAKLVGAVPVWNLERPLTFESLPSVIELLVETCLA